MQRRLRSADITVGNLESTLSTDGSPTQGGDSFAADPRVANGLRAAGFDALSSANNHAGDYGPGIPGAEPRGRVIDQTGHVSGLCLRREAMASATTAARQSDPTGGGGIEPQPRLTLGGDWPLTVTALTIASCCSTSIGNQAATRSDSGESGWAWVGGGGNPRSRISACQAPASRVWKYGSGNLSFHDVGGRSSLRRRRSRGTSPGRTGRVLHDRGTGDRCPAVGGSPSQHSGRDMPVQGRLTDVSRPRPRPATGSPRGATTRAGRLLGVPPHVVTHLPME